MIELSVIRDLVAIFGVIAGFSYYVLTVRNAQKNQKQQLETRQAQLFMQLYDRWAGTDFKKLSREVMEQNFIDYDDYISKYDSDINPEAYDKNRSLGSFYEGIGVLVKRNLIDPHMVDDLMSNAILRYWEKYGPIMAEIRVHRNYPQAGEWAEYLYNVIKQIVEQQHPELKT